MRVRLPPSKSVANRALVLAALAGGASVLRGLPDDLPGGLPEDVAAMLGALRALGVGVEFSGGALLVRGGGALGPPAPGHLRPRPTASASDGTTLGPSAPEQLRPRPTAPARGGGVASRPSASEHLRPLPTAHVRGGGVASRPSPPAARPSPIFLDVGAAGTALRFLLPLAALHCNAPVGFRGARRLFERPLAPLLGALASCGATWSENDCGGVLSPPAEGPASLDLEIDGGLSSQFASGLAMAAAGLPGGGVIRWAAPRSPLASGAAPRGPFVSPQGSLVPEIWPRSPLASETGPRGPLAPGAGPQGPLVPETWPQGSLASGTAPHGPLAPGAGSQEILASGAAPRGRPAPSASWGYLALTRDALEMFGCPARLSEDAFAVPGGALRPADVVIPGDWSAAAAFFCAAAVLGARVEASPLGLGDGQPDRAVLGILGECGSTWAFLGDACVFDGRLERGVHADLSGCPDLAPVLAAVAAAAPGPSLLRGLGALPHKESDRLEGVLRLVAWAGGRAERLPGPALAIHPAPAPGASGPLCPFDPMGDHRMAFAAAVASLRRGGGVADPACVAKSFPGFWGEWAKWGAPGSP
jgi:5-enolpyruvylshikimate-3-phosphate synthase